MFMLIYIVRNILVPKDHIKLYHIAEGQESWNTGFSYNLFDASSKKTGSLMLQA